MAPVIFDKTTGWWSIRYYAGPEHGRIKKTLCRHLAAWNRRRPPGARRPPDLARELTTPYIEAERQARLRARAAQLERPDRERRGRPVGRNEPGRGRARAAADSPGRASGRGDEPGGRPNGSTGWNGSPNSAGCRSRSSWTWP
jgi:hypothetical protein